MKKTLKIDSARVQDLQRCSIEVESRKDLLAFMIGQGMDITNAKFEEYEKEYQKYYFEYSTLKSNLETEVLYPEFGKEHVVSWNLDFNTEEATVEVK